MNARKYASARNISVTLTYDENMVTLEIEDDGRGFEPTSTPTNKEGGFGLTNMRRRAQIEGGALDIISNHGEGTKIRLVIPV